VTLVAIGELKGNLTATPSSTILAAPADPPEARAPVAPTDRPVGRAVPDASPSSSFPEVTDAERQRAQHGLR